MAALSYTQDNHEYLPVAFYADPYVNPIAFSSYNASTGYYAWWYNLLWVNLIRSYVKNEEVFFCPNNTRVKSDDPILNQPLHGMSRLNWNNLGYGWNVGFHTSGGSSNQKYGLGYFFLKRYFNHMPTDQTQGAVRLSQVDEAANTLMLGDVDNVPNYFAIIHACYFESPPGSGIYPMIRGKHNESKMVTYVDGHAALIKNKSIFKNYQAFVRDKTKLPL
jgi:prepilin-type processing-associated H-X9-DG protein